MQEEKKFVYLQSQLANGPFVYRLGLKIFILARGVRFPYGLLSISFFTKSFFVLEIKHTFVKDFKILWQIINQHLRESDNLKKED